MNELESPLKLTQDTHLQAEIQKEYTLKGSIRKERGLILFMVNPNTKECKQAKITSSAVLGLNNKPTFKHRCEYDPNFIYVYAINSKNAIRKVFK